MYEHSTNIYYKEKHQNKIKMTKIKSQKYTIYYKKKTTKTREKKLKQSHKNTRRYTVMYIIVTVTSN